GCEPLSTFLKAIAMPRRGELGVSALRAAISREMKRIDERQLRGASYCDEIVNTALMEIATGQSLCFMVFGGGRREEGLQSVGYGLVNAVMNHTTAKVEECNSKTGR